MAPPTSRAFAHDAMASKDASKPTAGVRSEQLEKLLNAWGAVGAAAYDAEAMVDQLLANTWAVPPPPTRTSLRGGSANALVVAASCARTESFTQQTKSMNELEAVLADSIARLLRHRQVLSDRIAALEKDNATVAVTFHEGLRSPERLLHQICVQMEDLEERFTKVSSTAVVIGDRLASLDTERARVLDTDEVMEALLALNDPSASRARSSNRLVATLQDSAQLHEAARVVKKMLVFSTELSSPVIAVAVHEIERLSQTIENDLLTEFSDAQERDHTRAMRKAAESLIEYNDKEKVADRYVWNVMKDRLAPSSDAQSLNPIQDLESLFAKIRAVCQDQFGVIAGVFPAAACTSVRELLVERLFNDPVFGIFSFLDQFLTTRQEPSSPASPEYVSLLCAAYERTCALAEQIELLELPASGSASAHARVVPVANAAAFSPLKEATELNTTPDAAAASPVGDRERMRAFLALQLHSLFASHRQRYFRTELDLLQAQCKEILDQVRFPAHVVPIKQKAKAVKSDKATAGSSSSASSSSSFSSSPSLPSAPTASTTNVLPPATPSSSNLERDITASAVGSATAAAAPAATTEAAVLAFYESLLAIAQDEDVPAQYAGRMKDALERCDVILKDNELRGELITKVFSSFMASFVEEYLSRIVAMTNDLLQEPLVSANSARQFFSVLEHVLKRIDFMDQQFETLVSPALRDWPTQLTICYESKRKCAEKLERGIALGLQQVLAVVDKSLAQILATVQDKSDFIGSETNMSLSCSRACKKCIDFLQPLVAAIGAVLVAENRALFLVALGAVFKELYLQHLQKFRFDPDGACMLLRDVNAYRQIFSGHRHDGLDDIFDVLHEVANLFALPPENVGSFIRDGKLAAMTKQSLTEILKRRWDYKTQGDKLLLQL